MVQSNSVQTFTKLQVQIFDGTWYKYTYKSQNLFISKSYQTEVFDRFGLDLVNIERDLCQNLNWLSKVYNKQYIILVCIPEIIIAGVGASI